MTRTAFLITLLIVFSLTAIAQHTHTNNKSDGTKSVEGKVAEINATKLILANDHGAQKEFSLNDKTKFRLLNKKSAKLDAIKPGLLVRVTFRPNDQTVTIVQETVKKFID